MKDILATVMMFMVIVMMIGLTPMIISVAYMVIKDAWGDRMNPWRRRTETQNLDKLLERLDSIRVLRVTCGSCDDIQYPKFRVHLPEPEWDEIQELLKKVKE